MREDITLEPITAEVVNQVTGRPASATIAFTLAFESTSPRRAVQAANVLTSLCLEENIKGRAEKARETYEFLELQLSELRSEMSRLEEKIARFKEKHVNELPELMVHNMNTLERLQRDAASLQERIDSLENRRIYLQGQLATIEPKLKVLSREGARIATEADDLESLRREHMALRSKLSDKHPDVVALRKQIDSLSKEIGVQEDLDVLSEDIKKQERDLAMLRKRYSPLHPDVKAAGSELEKLKARFDEASRRERLISQQPREADNPAYVSVKTQIEATRMELSAAKRELADVKKKVETYSERVERTPQVEQLYRALQRDYENAQSKYRETMDRLMAAKEAKGLEQSRLAEKFTLIDPPATPEKPVRPNRMALMLVGLFLSSAVGVGFASAAEFLDRSVRTTDELARLCGHPVLAEVPYWRTRREIRRRRARRVMAILVFLALLAGAAVAIHFFYRPLDVLAVHAYRKIMLNLNLNF